MEEIALAEAIAVWKIEDGVWEVFAEVVDKKRKKMSKVQ